MEQAPSPDTTQWSSAIGHASTGKSGRVIERLQQQIDQVNREKQLLKLRHEEAEKATDMLSTRNQYLQDRISTYESSHEANLRQLQRRERQVEDLREELRREKLRTSRAEEAMKVASVSEDVCKEQAAQARAIAQHKEAEYDAIAACRNMDNDRHQNGLNKIRANLEYLLQQRVEDLEKQKRLEIIAEQQKQTIEQLEELTKRLSSNFKMYSNEIDSAVEDLRKSTGDHDRMVHEKVKEMQKVTGQMRWVMNVENVLNRKGIPANEARPEDDSLHPAPLSPSRNHSTKPAETPGEIARPLSSGKRLGIDFRRHKKKESKPGR